MTDTTTDDTDDANDIDDVFDGAQTGSRHTTDPAADDQSVVGLVDYHLEAIDRGENNNMVAARDDRLAATVRALDEAGESERVINELVEQSELVGADVRASQSGLLKTAAWIGLATACPDVVDDAKAGVKAHRDRNQEVF